MSAQQKPAQTADEDLNDIGNAQRLANMFYGQIAYVPELGKWRRWTGKRWIDDNDEAMRDAQVVARSWFDDLAAEPDTGRQRRLLIHAQRSSSIRSLRAMIDISRTRGLTVPIHEWDRDPMLLGTPSGAIDLRTGLLLPPNPQTRISKAVAAEYKSDATAPTWCAFLDRIMRSDIRMIAFLQRAVGYSLTGSTREQCLFLCFGHGSNGKSVLLGTIRNLFADYGRDCAAETLLAKRDGGIPNDIARLAGARFISAVETEDGRRLAESLVKSVTGGDRITARFLHQEFFEFVPGFKIWLATNHKPTIRGDEHAIWRRIRLIPFDVTIPDAEQDGNLLTKLAAERAGILRWAIDGCLAWQRDGLQTPEPVTVATTEYREDSDRLGQWIAERCVLGEHVKMQAWLAYRDYRDWTEARGEHALTLTSFGNRLAERGVRKIKGRMVVYQGIGLCDTSDSSETFPGFSSRGRVYKEKPENVSQVSPGVAETPGDDEPNEYEQASRGSD